MKRPQPEEMASWGHRYTDLVGDDVLDILAKQADQFPDFLLGISHLENYAYAPGKWTIKEMLGHIIDTERVFVYRLMCFARNEQQFLPGFDENNYVESSSFAGQSLTDLTEEFRLLRKANMYLFKSLKEHELDRKGTASQKIFSTRSVLFLCAGHLIHHVNVIKERYL